MKKGWEYKKLGEVGTFSRGINFAKSDFVKDGFPCIHYGQIHTTFGPVTYKHLSCIPQEIVKKDKLASKGNLVIAITSEDVEGSCKCTAWMGDYDIAVGAHAAIFKHQLNPIFVSYFFSSPLFQKAKEPYVHGFKVMEIKPSDIAKISIPVPPLSEQQSIVNYLDSAFAKIDALKANAEKALGEAKALFQASLKEMLEPKEGWEEKKLQEVACDFSRGKSKHRPRNDKKLFGGNYPFIQTGEIRNANVYVTSHSSTYNEIGLSQSKLWPKDTVCITIAANIAEVAILKYPSCFPDSVIGFVADINKVDKMFVFYSLIHYQQELKKQGKGSAQDNINLGTFEKNRFPFPSLQEQHSIVATLDSLKSKVDRLQENYEKISKECDALKQAMLREIFE